MEDQMDQIESEVLNDYREWRLEAELKGIGLSVDDLRGKRVLDVGSGRGLLSVTLREQGIDCDFVNLEPRPSQQQSAKRWFETIQGIAQKLPFRDKTFDLVVSFGA